MTVIQTKAGRCLFQLVYIMDKKRIRGPNYQESDKIMLVKLISKYKDIVENKSSDGATLKEKKASWEKITNEYNATSLHNRSALNLKNLWENIKHDIRKMRSQERQAYLGTGGGPRVVPKPTQLMDVTLSVLGCSADGLYNRFDSDSAMASSNTEANSALVFDMELPVVHSDNLDHTAVSNTEMDNISVVEDWSEWSPKIFRRPLSSPLKQALGGQETTHEDTGLMNLSEEAGSSTVPCPTVPSPPASVREIRDGQFHLGKQKSTRRRPSRFHPSNVKDQLLMREKIEYFRLSSLHLKQEIEIRQILSVEWKKQEELKTKILEMQLKKLQGN